MRRVIVVCSSSSVGGAPTDSREGHTADATTKHSAASVIVYSPCRPAATARCRCCCSCGDVQGGTVGASKLTPLDELVRLLVVELPVHAAAPESRGRNRRKGSNTEKEDKERYGTQTHG